MNIIESPTTHKPSHSRGRKPGLEKVGHDVDHPIDENNLLKELENMVALNDRDEVFAIAKRIIHQGESALKPSVPQLVSVDEIAMKFNLCTRSIWRLVNKGDLPPPIIVGGARRWFATDVDSYLKKAVANRDRNQRHHRN